MRILSYNIPTPTITLSQEDRFRLKKVLKTSCILIVAAIALRILLPVPGKALAVGAYSTLFSGLIFIRYTHGDTLQMLPDEYPKIPDIALGFAFMLKPYSPTVGLILSAAAGIFKGFYLSRNPRRAKHEMEGF